MQTAIRLSRYKSFTDTFKSEVVLRGVRELKTWAWFYCQWGTYPCVCSSWLWCHLVLPEQLWPATICSMRWVLRCLAHAGPRSLKVMFCQAFLARGWAAWAEAIFRWGRCHLHGSFQISDCCIVTGSTWRLPWLFQSLNDVNDINNLPFPNFWFISSSC